MNPFSKAIDKLKFKFFYFFGLIEDIGEFINANIILIECPEFFL